MQGYRTYTIGGLINVADQSVAPPAKLQMSRGPVQMWMIFTKQFVFDKKTGLPRGRGLGARSLAHLPGRGAV